jgi:hypothetical protein
LEGAATAAACRRPTAEGGKDAPVAEQKLGSYECYQAQTSLNELQMEVLHKVDSRWLSG